MKDEKCKFWEKMFTPRIYNSLAKGLCLSGVLWFTKKNRPVKHGVMKDLSRSALGWEAKLWHAFTTFNIFLTLNNHSLNFTFTLMTYCILKGEYIDIPYTMRGILYNGIGGMHGTLKYPKLIHELCRRAKVPELLEDFLDYGTSGPFNFETMAKYKGMSVLTLWEQGGPSHVPSESEREDGVIHHRVHWRM